MEISYLLDISTREQLREWLIANSTTSQEVWVTANRSKQPRTDAIPYIDVVEEAL